MKRKWAYVALPLVLAALMLGVTWRLDNPTPTKEDLKVRRILLGGSNVVVVFYHGSDADDHLPFQLSAKEWKSFVESFHLSPQQDQLSEPESIRAEGMFISCALPPNPDGYIPGVNVKMNNHVGIYYNGDYSSNLHPATVKHWMKLLLNHPQIGPELRNRFK